MQYHKNQIIPFTDILLIGGIICITTVLAPMYLQNTLTLFAVICILSALKLLFIGYHIYIYLDTSKQEVLASLLLFVTLFLLYSDAAVTKLIQI